MRIFIKKHKRCMARLLIVIFSFAMLSPTLVSYAYKNVEEYILCEDYNNYATNATPLNAQIDAINSVITEELEGKNKYLSLSGKDAVSITYNIDADIDNTYYMFDLTVPNNNENTVISLVSGGKQFNAIKINADRNILTADGKPIGFAAEGAFVNVAVNFNKEFSRYTLYVNDKLVMEDWYVSSAYPTGKITAVSIKSEFDGEEELKLDKIVVYKSDKYIKSDLLKSNEYNTATQKKEVIDRFAANDFSAGYAIIHKEDFSGEFVPSSAFQPYPYENSIEVEQDEKTGERYICFSGSNLNSDCFATVFLRDVTNMTIQMDVKSPTFTPVRFVIYDKKVNTFVPLSILSGGQINAFEEKIGKIDKHKWTRIAINVDSVDNVVNYYVNGERVLENVPIPIKNFGALNSMRIIPERVPGERQVMIDNFLLAYGNDYKDYPGIFEGQIYEDIELYTRFLGTKTADAVFSEYNAFHDKTGIYYASKERGISQNLPYYDGEALMIPNDIAQAVFNTDNNTLQSLTKKESKNNTEYYSVDELAEKCKKVANYVDTGLVLVGNEKIELSEDSILKVNGYLVYQRPEAESLGELYKSGHPKYILNEERYSKIKKLFGTEKYITEWGNYIIEKADASIDLPPYEHGRADGLRISVCAPLSERTQALSMAYLLTCKKEYIDRLWKEIEAVCNYPDWGLGTHALDTASIGHVVTMAYDWFYDLWTPEQRKLMEEAVYKFALKHAYDIYYAVEYPDHSWPSVDMNWNPSCNGAMSDMASVFYDVYPEVCSKVIEHALRNMEQALNGFYPMGAWFEGTNYWGTTVDAIVIASDTLDNSFGTDFGVSLAPSFDKTANYTIQLCGPGGSNNYNDAGAMKVATEPMTFWLSSKFNNPGWAETRLYDMKLNNTNPSIYDILYYVDCGSIESSGSMLDSYFAGDDVVNMRSNFRDNCATFVSFHTGENLGAMYHSHIDSGTFVLDMLGQRFAHDLGAQHYNSLGMNDLDDTTGAKISRWSYYQLTPEGHNCILINPDESVGQNLYSEDKIDEFVSKERGAYAISDMSTAYEKNANSVKRGIMLGDDRRSVTIRDEIELKEANNEVWWFMHVQNKTKIEFLDDNTATMEINGKKIKVMVLTDAQSIEMSEMMPVQMTKTVPSQQYSLSDYKKLGIKLTGNGKMNITVKFIPYDDPAANNPVEDVALENWSVPDGELIQMPKADMISANGAEIKDFSSDMKYYVVDVPFTNRTVPKITASCPAGVGYEVFDAQDLEGTSSVRIYDVNNPQRYSTYYIKFRLDMSVLNEYKLNVAQIEASAEPQPENNKNLVIDGNLNTRWSADGKGTWLMLDLGAIKPIDYIGTAFMSGNARSTKYKLYISQDKNNWELIFDGKSSGETLDIELSPKIGKDARYVKFEGFGNSQNLWNSVTEIGVYKLP